MPVYEYQCTECGQIQEAFQKISEPALKTCSHCRGNLTKLISHSSFQLKGSGWYVTDYGGTKTGTETKSEKKIDTTDTKSKESKATSKKTTDPKD